MQQPISVQPGPRQLGPAVLSVLWAVFGVGAIFCTVAPRNYLYADDAHGPIASTAALTSKEDLAAGMVAGIDRFLLAETAASVERRAAHWHRDFSSHEAYEKSVAPNRERLARMIGAHDKRVEPGRFEVIAEAGDDGVLATIGKAKVYAVRWPVLPGIEGEGLLVRGTSNQVVIALPDADTTPETLLGLAEGLSESAQWGRMIAQAGMTVLVPVLVDRSDRNSIAGGRATNQPHREFVYRQAFEMGRHVIGYEVQKVLAAVDIFSKSKDLDHQTVVYGYGEGGLLALYAGALDTRIKEVAVSGYFGSRQNLWREPIYRNVFGLLAEFGDAELASLIAPRILRVSADPAPAIEGPPAPHDGRGGAAPGKIVSPTYDEVEKEFGRARTLIAGLKPVREWELVHSAVAENASAPDRNTKPTSFFSKLQGVLGEALKAALVPESNLPDALARQKRQIEQMVAFTQTLLAEAEYTRRAYWSKADMSSLDAFTKSTAAYREEFYRDVIGRFEQKPLPPNVRTRQFCDEPKYRGYEVVLDVFPDVFAYGIMLVPKEMKEDERRPVVVCQHGLEGRPQDVADPKVKNAAYNQYGCRLAERGFVVFAPQNPYIGQDKFRTLQRKLNPLGKTLFSIIVPQHQAIVDWLATQPFVDPERIAFYGLSYGGKTAMRVPALVSRYCLSICSADFNEWIWKNTSARSPYSYVPSGEYEIFEFNLGNTFNYAEMAALIAPRPFMVERGHDDGVAPDEWVAYEFAKVKRLYVKLGIGDRASIEFFDGPHTIHGVGTFEFLHRHLRWPVPAGETRPPALNQ